jgi:hypothetical protein
MCSPQAIGVNGSVKATSSDNSCIK